MPAGVTAATAVKKQCYEDVRSVSSPRRVQVCMPAAQDRQKAGPLRG
jgi:hypothetical protein